MPKLYLLVWYIIIPIQYVYCQVSLKNLSTIPSQYDVEAVWMTTDYYDKNNLLNRLRDRWEVKFRAILRSQPINWLLWTSLLLLPTTSTVFMHTICIYYLSDNYIIIYCYLWSWFVSEIKCYLPSQTYFKFLKNNTNFYAGLTYMTSLTHLQASLLHTY